MALSLAMSPFGRDVRQSALDGAARSSKQLGRRTSKLYADDNVDMNHIVEKTRRFSATPHMSNQIAQNDAELVQNFTGSKKSASTGSLADNDGNESDTSQHSAVSEDTARIAYDKNISKFRRGSDRKLTRKQVQSLGWLRDSLDSRPVHSVLNISSLGGDDDEAPAPRYTFMGLERPHSVALHRVGRPSIDDRREYKPMAELHQHDFFDEMHDAPDDYVAELHLLGFTHNKNSESRIVDHLKKERAEGVEHIMDSMSDSMVYQVPTTEGAARLTKSLEGFELEMEHEIIEKFDIKVGHHTNRKMLFEVDFIHGHGKNPNMVHHTGHAADLAAAFHTDGMFPQTPRESTKQSGGRRQSINRQSIRRDTATMKPGELPIPTYVGVTPGASPEKRVVGSTPGTSPEKKVVGIAPGTSPEKKSPVKNAKRQSAKQKSATRDTVNKNTSEASESTKKVPKKRQVPTRLDAKDDDKCEQPWCGNDNDD